MSTQTIKTKPLNRRIYLVLSILAIAALAAYWPSFTVPFYLDDRLSVVENQLLHTGTVIELWQTYGMRFVGYLTFWLNAQTSTNSIEALHLTNFAIHLMNGGLVFVLARLLTRHFVLNLEDKQIVFFAAVVSLVWLVHPLNTQAVTYIVQRLASLVTLFYLIALFSYFKIKLEQFSILWLLAFVISIVFGLLTKQNFLTLFVFILTFEVVFSEKNRQVRYWQAFLIAFLLLALVYPFALDLFKSISVLTKETTATSRNGYFVTQTVVIWLYIKKFFLPASLQLDMGIMVANPSSGLHFVALLAHIALIGIAIKAKRYMPLFTIGILLYYTGHSVESFVIPITDLAFEHRTYLPNIGLALAICSLIYQACKNYPRQLVFAGALTALLLVGLTYQRNLLWQDPYNFYQNDYQLAPESPRAMEAFALQLIAKGELDKAEPLLLKSVNENLIQGKVTVTGLNNLMLILFQQGKYQAAINTAMVSLKYIKQPKDKSLILSTIAYGYIKMGWCDFARGLSNKAVQLDSSNVRAKEYFEYCSQT